MKTMESIKYYEYKCHLPKSLMKKGYLFFCKETDAESQLSSVHAENHHW